MKNYSYIGISFIILIFGIYAVPKVVERFSEPDLVTIGAAPEFSLTNQNNETITNEDLLGKVYVAEFFFTTCPTICPMMNENMVKIQNEFYGNSNFGIASFSINPEKDSPEVLKAYAEKYGVSNPNWHMLTGDREKIYEMANKGYNLYVGINPEIEDGFEHSGYFALVDKEGNIRSRKDEHGNPIVYYNGLEDRDLNMLKQDIQKLL